MGKSVLFEGGVRTLSFIHSPLLQNRGFISNQLFHISDWLPTLYEAAGGNPDGLIPQNVTGLSQWKSLQQGSGTGPRVEVVNNIDYLGGANGAPASGPQYQYAMNRDYNGTLYKIIGGYVFNNSYTAWWEIGAIKFSNV